MQISIKRAYEPTTKADGYRVLVDRLWPRGVTKEKLVVNEWCKDIAPRTELRKWFNHEPEKFQEFSAKYQKELDDSDAPGELLKRAGHATHLTLVYGARDPHINHAAVLQRYLAAKN